MSITTLQQGMLLWPHTYTNAASTVAVPPDGSTTLSSDFASQESGLLSWSSMLCAAAWPPGVLGNVKTSCHWPSVLTRLTVGVALGPLMGGLLPPPPPLVGGLPPGTGCCPNAGEAALSSAGLSPS